MIIAVASGKGGTGKTTIAVNLALSLKNVQFLDCDVEEPNAHIFLKPLIDVQKKSGIFVPEIDETKCVYCGKCAEVCAYNAIAVLPPADDKKGSIMIFPQLCHGCGACGLLCPKDAIKEVNREIGVVEIGNVASLARDKDEIEFIQGRLNIGEAMSPPLIREVKENINIAKTVIIDAPPGTSCPVITAVKGSDFCILVTEPTPFGLNDLTLAVEVLRKMNIPFGVVINRSDLGDEKATFYCEEQNIPILMRIPFKREIAQAYSKGEPIVEVFPEYEKEFYLLYKKIREMVNETNCNN